MLNRGITELHKDLTQNKIKLSEVLKFCNERVVQRKELNAFVTLNPNRATEEENSTKCFKTGKPRSVLEGIPIAVKDNFCVKGMTTTCGSHMLRTFKPQYTASVVERLQKAGCVLMGKTNLDEFAMGSGSVDSIHGPTKNCWGLKLDKDWHIAGGSSGGSAVAVAAGTCLGALGSDTGGSTRNPAAYCGVVGLKPTYGNLSRYGLIPLVNSMDVPGILALTVEDACILLDTMAGHDVKDSTTVRSARSPTQLQSSVKSLKIGIPHEYNIEGLTDDVRQTWVEVAGLLAEGGASVLPMSMPHTQHSIVCYSVLNQCEVASNMARYDGLQFGYRSANKESTAQMFAHTRSVGFNHVVRSRILAGNYFLLHSNYEKYFTKALKVRRLIAEDFKHAWREGFHVLLTPTTLSTAPLYSDFMSKDHREQCATQDYCTQPANMAGCPAVSIPIKLSKKHLPISLQLMAPNMEESTMLSVAKYIQDAVQFDQYRKHGLSHSVKR